VNAIEAANVNIHAAREDNKRSTAVSRLKQRMLDKTGFVPGAKLTARWKSGL
jgi:hypothetical protein